MGDDSSLLFDIPRCPGTAFRKGVPGKSHFCLKAAIQELYADAGLIEQKHVDDFDATMLLRETADYRSDFSKEGAAASIESARMFLVRAAEILNVIL